MAFSSTQQEIFFYIQQKSAVRSLFFLLFSQLCDCKDMVCCGILFVNIYIFQRCMYVYRLFSKKLYMYGKVSGKGR